MNNEQSEKDMVLVYDLRRDARRQEILSGADEQWNAYLRGELLTKLVTGCITELFYTPYEGEHMFRLDEGNKIKMNSTRQP